MRNQLPAYLQLEVHEKSITCLLTIRSTWEINYLLTIRSTREINYLLTYLQLEVHERSVTYLRTIRSQSHLITMATCLCIMQFLLQPDDGNSDASGESTTCDSGRGGSEEDSHSTGRMSPSAHGSGRPRVPCTQRQVPFGALSLFAKAKC